MSSRPYIERHGRRSWVIVTPPGPDGGMATETEPGYPFFCLARRALRRQERQTRRLSSEDIARVYRVPYWLISDAPKPLWFRRPLWRLRALKWRRH